MLSRISLYVVYLLFLFSLTGTCKGRQTRRIRRDADQEQSLLFDDDRCGPSLKVGASARDLAAGPAAIGPIGGALVRLI